MFKFKAKSLATKLIVVTGGTIALVMLASNTVLIGQTQGRVADLVYSEADTEAKSIASDIATDIGQLASAARSMAGVASSQGRPVKLTMPPAGLRLPAGHTPAMAAGVSSIIRVQAVAERSKLPRRASRGLCPWLAMTLRRSASRMFSARWGMWAVDAVTTRYIT